MKAWVNHDHTVICLRRGLFICFTDDYDPFQGLSICFTDDYGQSQRAYSGVSRMTETIVSRPVVSRFDQPFALFRRLFRSLTI